MKWLGVIISCLSFFMCNGCGDNWQPRSDTRPDAVSIQYTDQPWSWVIHPKDASVDTPVITDSNCGEYG